MTKSSSLHVGDAAAANYKARKEAFVSDLSGGSLSEINLVTLVAPAAILLWSALQSRQSFFNPYSPIAFVVDFLLNVAAVLFAITAYSSAPALLNLLLLLPATLLLLPLKPQAKPTPKRSSSSSGKISKSSPSQFNGASNLSSTSTSTSISSISLPVRPFLTNYRGGMMIVTCLAILAVDFQIFPRRFAKVENWGTSLMDMGVGSFVFSAGVVSARSLLRTKLSPPSPSPSPSSTPKSFPTRFAISIRHSLPLLVLGFIRLYSVKGLDYAEHVTEYGVHWNFFFTLGLLPPFVELSDLLTKHVRGLSYDVLAMILALGYEIVLDNTTLKAYILVSPRGPDLLSKNREGVFSFIGYLAIFLAGRSTGLVVLDPSPAPHAVLTNLFKSTTTTTTTTTGNSKKSLSTSSSSVAAAVTKSKNETKTLLSNLLVQSGLWILLYMLCTSYTFRINLSVSRRLANLPYVLWVSAFNTSQITLLYVIELIVFGSSLPFNSSIITTSSNSSSNKGSSVSSSNPQSSSSFSSSSFSSSSDLTPKQKSSYILHAFNNNGLPVFLVANLLTGLVNLSVNTLDAEPKVAMAVLLTYAAAVTGTAVGLEELGRRWGWKIRF